jgi:hypothetical protein
MAELAATERAHRVVADTDEKQPNGCDSSRRKARNQRPLPIAPLPQQLTTSELISRVAEIPSREGMRPPRSDFADNLARFYQALWRHARARETGRYRLTWGQLAAACGYEQPSYNTNQLTTLERYSRVLEEAGLVRISGRDELADGRTCVVTLLRPPERLESADGRRSSAGRALHS